MAWFDELNLPGATIDGHFGFIRADGPDDDDYPDVALANGWVTFKATTPAARVDGAWLGIEEVRAQIFEGQIVVSEEDSRPVRLLATDAPIGVADWAWRASFDLHGFRLNDLVFKAPRDTTVNLTADLIPIKSQPYQIIEGASIVDTEVDTVGERMRFKMSDGTFTGWVNVPNGEPGAKGDKGDKGDPGADGQSPTIAMGAVSTGTTADAWMTGTPLARELNLTLPRGVKGDKGDTPTWADLPGKPTSFPTTVANVSGIVVDTSVGVRVTIGGHLVHASTGRRNITSLFSTGLDPENTGAIYISRQDGRAIIEFIGVKLAAGSGTITWPNVLPTGFSPLRSGTHTTVTRANAFTSLQLIGVNGSTMYWLSELSPASSVSSTTTHPTVGISGQIEYGATSWPTTLPGTPA